jgi:hypothetical protein
MGLGPFEDALAHEMKFPDQGCFNFQPPDAFYYSTRLHLLQIYLEWIPKLHF